MLELFEKLELFPEKSDVACACIMHQGRLLFLKRAPNKLEGNRWNLPGGKCDFAEAPKETCIREIWEECQIDLSQRSLVLCGRWKIRKNGIEFILAVFYSEFLEKPNVVLQEESIDAAWWTMNEALEQKDLITAGQELLRELSEMPYFKV